MMLARALAVLAVLFALRPALAAGDIVLIGISAPGLKDVRATPLDSTVPGVELHVQMLEQLLTGTRLTRPDYAPPLELILTLAVGLLIAIALPRVPAAYSSGFALLVLIGIFGGTWYAFTKQSLLFDPVNPSIGVVVMVGACTAWTYRQTQNQRGEIRRAPEVPAGLEAKARQAAGNCPERAITLS